MEKPIILTKKKLRAYLAIASAVLALFGYANYQAALAGARQALKETAAVDAIRKIQELKEKAQTNSDIIEAQLHALRSKQFLTNVYKTSVAVEALYSFHFDKDANVDKKFLEGMTGIYRPDAMDSTAFFKKFMQEEGHN